MVTNQDRSEHLWVENLENTLARPGQRLLDHVNGTIEKITFLGDFYELDKDIVEMAVLSAIFHDIGKLKKHSKKVLLKVHLFLLTHLLLPVMFLAYGLSVKKGVFAINR